MFFFEFSFWSFLVELYSSMATFSVISRMALIFCLTEAYFKYLILKKVSSEKKAQLISFFVK